MKLDVASFNTTFDAATLQPIVSIDLKIEAFLEPIIDDRRLSPQDLQLKIGELFLNAIEPKIKEYIQRNATSSTETL